MRCLCWFLLVVLLLLIFLPISVFIGFIASKARHPKTIDHQIRHKFNFTRHPTTIVSTISPVTEKEEDLSNLYIKGSMIGGENRVSNNVNDDKNDSENEFRAKVSDSKMKIGTARPIKAAREPDVEMKESNGFRKSDGVKGFLKGEEENNSSSEWKKSDFESKGEEDEETDKQKKAARVKETVADRSEESAERYLIEGSENESKNTSELKKSKRADREESTEQESFHKKGSLLDDEPENEQSRTSETKKKITKDQPNSDEYDEVEEEQMVVKKKKIPKNVSDE